MPLARDRETTYQNLALISTTPNSFNIMRSFTFLNRIRLSLLLLTAIAFVVTACETQDTPQASTASPSIQAELGGYGSCGTCPLPADISGTLPAQLYPTSSWNTNMDNCFLEDLSDAGPKCKYRTTGTTHQNMDIQVYLQFSTSSGNTQTSFCSYFYQVGNALSASRPSGNWLLDSINYMVHQTGSYYNINVTWRSYMCTPMHSLYEK